MTPRGRGDGYTRRTDLRDPAPLAFAWRAIVGRAAIADVGPDSLYVHGPRRGTPHQPGAFVGRINGVVVVRDEPTLWRAQVATEAYYRTRFRQI